MNDHLERVSPQPLSTCPVCSCPPIPLEEYCRRCECHLDLLGRVRQYAEKLASEGKIFQSKALYKKD